MTNDDNSDYVDDNVAVVSGVARIFHQIATEILKAIKNY